MADIAAHRGAVRYGYPLIMGNLHTKNEGPNSRDQKTIGTDIVASRGAVRSGSPEVYWIMRKLHTKNEVKRKL